MKKIEELYLKCKAPIWAVGALIILAFPWVAKKESIITIGILILIYMIFASALNITNGYIGLFNVGIAGFMCIGAYTTGLLYTKLNAGFFICLFASALTSSMIGALFALPTNRFSGLYFAITTMGFSEIVRLIALNWNSFTNGSNGIMGIKRPLIFGLKFQSGKSFYYLILVILILVLFCIRRILKSRVGRAWISIRENPDAAKSLGVNIATYKSLNFLVMGFIAGIGGSLLTYYYGYIAPDMFVIDNGHEVLAMVMVGGAGTMAGPLAGSFILTLGMQLFRSVSEYRMIAYGIMLLLMMWIRPQGIIGATNTVMAQKSVLFKKMKRKNNGGDKV
jgi:branched-chain amino acid transport system permease protein